MAPRYTAAVIIFMALLVAEAQGHDPDKVQDLKRTKRTMTGAHDLPYSAQSYAEDGVVISSGSPAQPQPTLKALLTSPGQASVRDATASHRRFLQDKRGPIVPAPAPAPRGVAYAPAVPPAVTAGAMTGIDPASLKLGALGPPVIGGGGLSSGTGMTIGGFSFSGR